MKLNAIGVHPIFPCLQGFHTGLFREFPVETVVVSSSYPGFQADKSSLWLGPDAHKGKSTAAQSHIGRFIRAVNPHFSDLALLKHQGVPVKQVLLNGIIAVLQLQIVDPVRYRQPVFRVQKQIL